MSSSRSRTDTIVLVSLFVGIVALYISSFYVGSIEGVGYNNLVSNVRFLIDRTVQPILIGAILAVFLESIFPKHLFSFFMAGSGIKPIFNALWIGIFSKKCTSEIVHSGLSMNKSGVSLGASITYILIAPINSFSLVFLLVSLYGLHSGLLLIVSAISIAFLSGLTIDLLQVFRLIDRPSIVSRVSINFSIMDEITKHFKIIFSHFTSIKIVCSYIIDGLSVLYYKLLYSSKWLILGILLASLFASGLEEIYIDYMVGSSLLSLLIVFIFAAIIEVFDEGVIIISFLFFHLTGALGTAFIFLMGAHFLDSLESGDLRKGIGIKVTIIIFCISTLFLFVLGYLLN